MQSASNVKSIERMPSQLTGKVRGSAGLQREVVSAEECKAPAL